MSSQRNVHDYIPIARSVSVEAFAQRYNHPFLFGREVLEEEFRFSTLVTEEPSADPRSVAPGAAAGSSATTTGSGSAAFKIRHWVIPIKKPATSAGQDRIFVGRAESNDICVPHKTVSKLHAYFQRDAGLVDAGQRDAGQRDAGVMSKWFVVDTGSANGTKHNGVRIPARAKAALLDGDTVVFGRCVFQYFTARTLHERLLTLGEKA